MLNSFNCIGRLTKDVQARTIKGADGKEVLTTSFTLAVDRRMTKAQRDAAEKAGRPTADFISFTAWGKLAETLSKYAKKGQMIAATGRIETRHYEKDGHTVYVTECRLSEMSFIGGTRANAGTAAQVEAAPVQEAEPAAEADNQNTGDYSLASDDLPF